jgi:hypothetical protein
MEKQDIKDKLINSINRFLKDDYYLIQNNLSERAITHKLGEYLQNEFPNHNVDCEYNKFQKSDENGYFKYIDKHIGILPSELTKRLEKKYEEKLNKLDLDSLLSLSVYPDIIVHTRGFEGTNVLVVEVKKGHGESDDLDKLKLRAFTESGANPFKYQIGVSIKIKTNKDNVKDFKIEFPTLIWFENGQEVTE